MILEKRHISVFRHGQLGHNTPKDLKQQIHQKVRLKSIETKGLSINEHFSNLGLYEKNIKKRCILCFALLCVSHTFLIKYTEAQGILTVLQVIVLTLNYI